MATAAAPAAQAPASSLRERILLVVLYITVLSSSVAFIEPSPHDGLMGLLALACLIAGVRFQRKSAPLFLLLVLWNVAGLVSLFNRPDEATDIQYAATSIYLAVAAIMFAFLFADNTMRRLGIMRAAYITTATVISLAGIAGYFHLVPGAAELFAPFGRALGGFKDPNVFGPFLIWPTLVVLDRMVARRVRITDLATAGILLLGILLSFSRGAWFHFAVSSAVMIVLAFLTAPTPAARLRIFALSAIAVVGIAALVAILLSSDAVGTMIRERAQLQAYDVNDGGRFGMQEKALAAMLQFPNGMGPFGFATANGMQQHNVYLQAFMVYGWAGGVSYILLLLSTLWIGLRTALINAPWQPYLVTAVSAFVGEMAEGFVIDSDHWRHFFLLLGIIWGLATVTFNQTRAPQNRAPPLR